MIERPPKLGNQNRKLPRPSALVRVSHHSFHTNIMKIPIDYHMHSQFSEDGDDTLESMCQRAIALGIPEIGFAEHWDVGPYETNPRYFKPEPWYAELERLRNRFAGQLVIRAGIEIDEPHLFPDEAKEVLQRDPFDYVIGSVHYVGENFMFNAEYFRTHTADEVYEAYFAELDRMVRSADLDIVAHFDIPARTGIPVFGYDPARYEEKIRSVLKTCIERNLALDVNVSGLRKPARNLMPDRLILQWYAEMGGQRLTLGSDAHRLPEVGLHLEKAIEAIRAVGIIQITQFKQRQARFVSS
jgi:histidinol-phosphatase (PHP family)